MRSASPDRHIEFTVGIFNKALITLDHKLLSFPGGKALHIYYLPHDDRTNEIQFTRQVVWEIICDQNDMAKVVE